MKNNYSWPIAIAASVLLPAISHAQQDEHLNRFTFSSRFGYNISAKFKGFSTRTPANPRTTPDGSPYNYDDGYVLTDVSDNAGGQTWNWGYDRDNQVSGNTILMSRSTLTSDASASKSFNSDPSFGGELVFNRQLGTRDNVRFGVEAAANYQNISLSDNSRFIANISRTTDAYPFSDGTTPPGAPYQGSFNGPGFVIGDTPVNSVTSIVPGASISDHRRYEADLWGFRLGPYVEIPLNHRLSVAASAGLAVGVLNGNAVWRQTVSLESGGTTSNSGQGNDCDVLWGGYVEANVIYKLNEHWSAVGGAQYQNLDNYTHTFGGRKVAIDLSKSFFVTIGVGYSF
jgi:hypothetical protein